MSSKRYVGKKVTALSDPTSRMHRSSVAEIANAALTQSQINSQIAAKLGPYASKAYVDQQDALRASRAYVDQQDALRVPLTQKHTIGGPVSLGATGTIWTGNIRPEDQGYQRSPRQYFGPSSYPSSSRSFTGETTLLTVSIADPGYTYRVLCWGVLEAVIDNDRNSYSAFLVRVGSSSGTIVSKGMGAWRIGASYASIYPTATSQSPRTGSTTLYIRGVRSNIGTGGMSAFYQNIAAMVIPA